MDFRQRTMAVGAAAAMCVAATAVPAATINYTGSAQGTDYSVIFDDSPAGAIDVQVSATANPNMADLLGLAFDFAVTPMLTAANFVFGSSNTGEGITDVCFNTSSCGQGLNFNGGATQSVFDYIVRLGEQGTQGGNYLMSFNFSILTDGTLADLGPLAIRAQSTGPNGEGSLKLELTPDNPAPIPLPAAGFLLVGALGALGLIKRRKAV